MLVVPSGPAEQENVAVGVRVRPLNKRENNANAHDAWTVHGNQIAPRNQHVKADTYTFDWVFDQSATNAHVYDCLARNIVHAATHGFNGTIFCYGQTASGKTHTMQGTRKEPGIIPLAVEDIIRTTEEKTQGREWTIRMTYVEIYNEVVRDLLNPNNTNMRLVEQENQIIVKDVTELLVVKAKDVMSALAQGEANRSYGETDMNARSSRSHTILTFVIESYQVDNKNAVTSARLNLVDLAGSERAAHTNADGARLKEGGHINKSLLALTSVIARLADPARMHQHIPYRDSKLTRILQPSLGGNAKTAIICNVTPASSHLEDTNSTLQFATRAKHIQNKPILNETITGEEATEKYESAIKVLQKKLEEAHKDKLKGVEMANTVQAKLAHLMGCLPALPPKQGGTAGANGSNLKRPRDSTSPQFGAPSSKRLRVEETLETVTLRIEVLNKELQENAATIDRLTRERDASAEEVAALRADMATQANEIARLQARQGELEAEVIAMTEEVEAATRKYEAEAAAVTRKGDLVQELEANLAAVTDEHGRLVALRARLEMDLAARADRIAELEAQVADLDTTQTALDAALADLEQSRADAAELTATLAKTQAQLQAATDRTAELEPLIDDVARLERDLTATTTDRDSVAAQLAETCARGESLAADLDAAQRDRTTFRLHVAHLETTLLHVEQAQVARLAQIADLESHVAAFRATEAQLTAERGDLQGLFEDQVQEYETLERMHADVNRQLAEVSQRAEELLADLMRTREDLAAARDLLVTERAKFEVATADSQARLDEATRDLADLRTQLDAKRADCDELMVRLDATTADREHYATQVAELDEQVENLAAQLTAVTEQGVLDAQTIADLTARVEDREGQLRSAEERGADLDRELTQTQARATELEAQVTARDAELDKLQAAFAAEYAAGAEKARAIVDFEARIAALDSAVTDTQARLDLETSARTDVESQLAALQTAHDELVRHKARLVEELALHQASEQDIQAKFRSTATEVDRLSQELLTAQAALAELRRAHDDLGRQYGEVTEDRDALKARIEQGVAMYAEVRVQKEELEGKVEELQAQIKRGHEYVARMQAEHDEAAESASEVIARLEASVEALTESERRLNAVVDEQRAAIEKVEHDKADLEARLVAQTDRARVLEEEKAQVGVELADTVHRLAQLQTEHETTVAELDETTQALQDHLADLEAQAKDLADRTEDLAAARTTLEETRAQLVATQGAVEERDAAIARFQADVAAAAAEIEQRGAVMAQQAADLAAVQHARDELTAHCAVLSEQIAALEQQHEATTAHLQHVEREVAALETELQGARKLAERMQETADVNDVARMQLRQTIEAMTADAAVKAQELEAVRAAAAEAQIQHAATFAEVEQQRNVAMEQWQAATAALNQASNALSESSTRIAKLEAACEVGNTKLAAAHEEKAALIDQLQAAAREWERKSAAHDELVAHLNAQLASRADEVATLESNLGESQRQAADLRDQSAAQQTELGNLQSALDRKRADLAANRNTNSALESRLHEVDTALAQLRAEHAAQSEKMQETAARNESLNEGMDLHVSLLRDVREILERTEADLQKARARSDELERVAAEQQQELQARLETLERDAAQQAIDLKLLRSENTELQASKTAAEETLAALRAKFAPMESKSRNAQALERDVTKHQHMVRALEAEVTHWRGQVELRDKQVAELERVRDHMTALAPSRALAELDIGTLQAAERESKRLATELEAARRTITALEKQLAEEARRARERERAPSAKDILRDGGGDLSSLFPNSDPVSAPRSSSRVGSATPVPAVKVAPIVISPETTKPSRVPLGGRGQWYCGLHVHATSGGTARSRADATVRARKQEGASGRCARDRKHIAGVAPVRDLGEPASGGSKVQCIFECCYQAAS
ncbi:hypothetical protein AMAG_15055 [Allomyces macrogynus ATCC 38327]|uniref:Kinesin motor domain-containing protein n=1 Tax=Allomyces macrogynus (strain ATCC 38327) TaxID=578462 RepID=A0A0L0T5K2_ALLM3|nr:hypothetical protein AMAG_15055 [Allomyces macrogynus ATCC 38327]|eukprot:KNE70073.1 hypothetical protein AMAG_15055 [Allomyces macrogynus ATCC 38327]